MSTHFENFFRRQLNCKIYYPQHHSIGNQTTMPQYRLQDEVRIKRKILNDRIQSNQNDPLTSIERQLDYPSLENKEIKSHYYLPASTYQLVENPFKKEWLKAQTASKPIFNLSFYIDIASEKTKIKKNCYTSRETMLEELAIIEKQYGSMKNPNRKKKEDKKYSLIRQLSQFQRKQKQFMTFRSEGYAFFKRSKASNEKFVDSINSRFLVQSQQSGFYPIKFTFNGKIFHRISD